jgi:glycosyltransferase involved in cell wall biosynthesis
VVTLDFPSSLWVRWQTIKLYDQAVLAMHCRNLSNQFTAKKNRVIYIFHPDYAIYAQKIPHDILVYHPFDDFAKQGGQNESFRENEAYLFEHANLVITPSEGVTDILSKRSGRKDVTTVRNGVDFAAFSEFSSSKKTQDKKKEDGIKIAYIGSINVKVDIGLLLFLAVSLPKDEFHLIGPVANMGAKKSIFEQLQLLKNVHFHGRLFHTELPKVAAQMDCLLMCYDTSPELWAKYSYPLKLNEYLATKKPVITCELDSVAELKNICDIASTKEEWLGAIEKVKGGSYNKIEAGYTYASKQDWMTRVDQIANLLDKNTPQPKK